MNDVIEEFFSLFHTGHLKRRGYTKKRRTFSRKLTGFTERIQIQGSVWNAGALPWHFYVHFYVNFGVQFDRLPPRSPDRDLPETHCWTRIDSIVPEAPREFDLLEGDQKLAS